MPGKRKPEHDVDAKTIEKKVKMAERELERKRRDLCELRGRIEEDDDAINRLQDQIEELAYCSGSSGDEDYERRSELETLRAEIEKTTEEMEEDKKLLEEEEEIVQEMEKNLAELEEQYTRVSGLQTKKKRL